jgi:hypothetical protein
MTLPEFTTQFERILRQFRPAADADTSALMSEWFDAFRHLHVDAFEVATTRLIREATDTYWPAIGTMREIVQSRMDRYERTSGKCGTCHGSTCVEAWPVWCHGMVYRTTTRCTACGVPVPQMPEQKHTRPLKPAEVKQWESGGYRDVMPEGLKAKKDAVVNPEMRQWCAGLALKLFGREVA